MIQTIAGYWGMEVDAHPIKILPPDGFAAFKLINIVPDHIKNVCRVLIDIALSGSAISLEKDVLNTMDMSIVSQG